MLSLGGGGDSTFNMRWMVYALCISLMLPMFLALAGVGASTDEGAYSDQVSQLDSDYASLTGSTAATETVNVWCLAGVYTPYSGGSSYGYDDSGWLYGSRIVNYSPTQYASSDTESYTVTWNEDGYYTYATTPSGDTSKSVGDVYTMVAMDTAQKSDLFFSTSGKTVTDSGYYYTYTGYRYAFSPLGDYTGVDSEGNKLTVTDKDTLSLVWYQSKSNVSGIAGQLMLTTDRGLAYITASEIVSAYNNSNMTATFKMDFNGVTMNIIIRMNPTYIAQGESVQTAYDLGHWSLMVSSPASATDYSTGVNGFDVANIFGIIVDLFTFNMGDYGLDAVTATLCSLLFVAPLYLALIVIGMNYWPVLFLAAILAVVQSGWSLFG